MKYLKISSLIKYFIYNTFITPLFLFSALAISMVSKFLYLYLWLLLWTYLGQRNVFKLCTASGFSPCQSLDPDIYVSKATGNRFARFSRSFVSIIFVDRSSELSHSVLKNRTDLVGVVSRKVFSSARHFFRYSRSLVSVFRDVSEFNKFVKHSRAVTSDFNNRIFKQQVRK